MLNKFYSCSTKSVFTSTRHAPGGEKKVGSVHEIITWTNEVFRGSENENLMLWEINVGQMACHHRHRTLIVLQYSIDKWVAATTTVELPPLLPQFYVHAIVCLDPVEGACGVWKVFQLRNQTSKNFKFTAIDIPACWLDTLAVVDGVEIQDKEVRASCCCFSNIVDVRSARTQCPPCPSNAHYQLWSLARQLRLSSQAPNQCLKGVSKRWKLLCHFFNYNV